MPLRQFLAAACLYLPGGRSDDRCWGRRRLPRALARSLVLQTMKGSVAMLEESGQHPAVLKDQVTSPGGTTIAGVRELEGNGLRRAFFRAVRQAWERSIELGKK